MSTAPSVVATGKEPLTGVVEHDHPVAQQAPPLLYSWTAQASRLRLMAALSVNDQAISRVVIT
jgi:hypothetical protein